LADAIDDHIDGWTATDRARFAILLDRFVDARSL
jgi:hypothetical protein